MLKWENNVKIIADINRIQTCSRATLSVLEGGHVFSPADHMFWALLTCDCYYSVDALIFTHFLMTYMRSEFTYDSRMTLIKLNWFRYLVITNLFLISLGLVINIFLISENVCLPLINDWSDGVLMKKVAAGASTDMASCNSDVDKHLTNGQNQYSSHSLPQRFTSKFTLRSCLHKHVTP